MTATESQPVPIPPATSRRLPSRRAVAWALALALCAAFLFFYRLADRDLWSSHEARAAQDAQSMLLDDAWGLPRLIDGKPDFQKPPLFYWLVAATAWCRGGVVDAWSVRLPAALAAWFGVAGLAALLLARGRPVAALVAAAALATMCHFTWLARVGRIDMPLTLAVGLAIGSFHLAGKRSGFRAQFGWQLLGYGAVAMAALLKGPIGALLPAVVLGCRFGLGRFFRNQPDTDSRSGTKAAGTGLSSLWWGVPLMLALTLPWYWWANEHTHGEFLRIFFWHHNVERGLGANDEGSMHARPWWFYGVRLGVDLFPASLLLPIALWYFLRRRRWRSDAEAQLGLVWLTSITLFLSLFGFKRADYLLPAYPGAALLVGCAAEGWYRSAAWRRRLALAFAGCTVACLAGWFVYFEQVMPVDEAQNEQRTFAAAIRELAPAPKEVMFFRIEDHLLYFHLGRPIHTFLEWENLDVWAGRPGCHYIVMDTGCAAEWPQHVTSGRLEEVLRNTDRTGTHKHPLVLMRTHPRAVMNIWQPPAPQ